jgi:hypothetical protein
MTTWKEIRTTVLFCVTLGLSAALLFSLQPMVGKILLPTFGGASSVWTTCLIAYQLIYFSGCLWVFVLSRLTHGWGQAAIHLTMLFALFLVLPPDRLVAFTQAAPVDGNPVPWLLSHLLFCVGPPLFVTSTTSSLLQSWFSRVNHQRSNDPYFLNIASNAGSLFALFAYPFLIESNFSIGRQARLWTICYVAYVLCVAACALIANRRRDRAAQPAAARTPYLMAPSWSTRLAWVIYSFLPSTLLSGSTFYLSEFVSVTPLLWILPLSLYLVSLIWAFSDRAMTYRKVVYGLALVFSVPWFFDGWESHQAIFLIMPLHLVSFLLVTMALHTRLAEIRPTLSSLPEFYVWMAFGGVLGGAANGMLAPALLRHAWEYPMAIAAAGAAIAWVVPIRFPKLRYGGLILPLIFLVMIALKREPAGSQVLFRERNFYGITTVVESTGTRYLVHNSYMQSKQDLGLPGRKEPYANLGHESGIGQVLDHLNTHGTPPNVAVIGMGAGVLATYARPETKWTYYELNPSIVHAVHELKLFTYIDESPSKNIDVVLGDARRQMEKAADHSFDLVVIDAFNSTALPAHLITREAFDLYFQKAKTGGMVAMNNISMLYDLSRVACRYAQEMNLTCVTWRGQDWVFVAKDLSKLEALRANPDWNPVSEKVASALWTDEFTNPSGIILWPRLRKARAFLRSLAGRP